MSKSIGFGAAATALLVFLGLGLIYQQNYGDNVAIALRDCTSIGTYANEARAQGQEDVARYREQEQEACEQHFSPAQGSPNGTSPAGPSTVSTVPNQPGNPATPVNGPPTAQQNHFYYANEPVVAQEWSNSFAGNPVARKPSLAGRGMESLNPEEAIQEGDYRCRVDPMLAWAQGVQHLNLEQPNAQGQLAITKGLETDLGARNKLCDAVLQAKRQYVSVTPERLGAGTYCSTFSYGGAVPLVVTDCNVQRKTPFVVVKFVRKDGSAEYERLACGLQRYWWAPTPPPPPEAPKAPPVTKGMDRTEEGVPVIPPSGGGTPTPTPPKSTPPGTTPPSTPPSTPPTTPSTSKPPEEVCPPGQVGKPPTCKDTEAQGPATVVTPPQRPNQLPASPTLAEPSKPDLPPPPPAYTPPVNTPAPVPPAQGGPTQPATPRPAPPQAETGAPPAGTPLTAEIPSP